MGTNQSPTFPRFQLGKQLRELREQAGLTTEEVARNLDCSASTVSRIEGGRVGVRRGALIQLFELYRVTEEEHRKTLSALAKQGKQRGWFARFGDLPATYSRFIGLESAAVAMRDYEPLVIPGLLQTEDYARAIVEADPSLEPAGARTRIRVRMERQGLLTRSNPLTFFAILDESVIRRVIGGVNVMRDQLKHLMEMAQLRNVTVQVLPFSEGAYAGMVGSFVILDFEEDIKVVYTENLSGDIYQESDDTSRYEAVFDNLRAAAMSPLESIKLVEAVWKSAALPVGSTPMMALDERWHKATRSGSNGQCVEARFQDGVVEVRNSNRPEGGSVAFTRGEWETFIAAVSEDGEFRLS